MAIALALCLHGCRALSYKSPVPESQARCQHFSREGVTAMEIGDWREAESLLRKALGASPDDPDARRHLAETLWTRGEQDEALDHMRASAQLEPASAEVAIRLGEMYLASGRAEAAIAEADRAIALDSSVASGWALRGRAHRAVGDGDRALADLHNALHRQPQARDLLADVASLYFESGRRRRELTTLHMLRDTYVPGEEPVELVMGEADAYLALGRPRQAVDRLRVACEREAPSAGMLCRLAEAEAAAGQTHLARQTAKRALMTDAQHEPARQLVARLNATQRQ
ncbi:MAG: tetratricopeptide repeat protein [Planctomycetota bacterium]